MDLINSINEFIELDISKNIPNKSINEPILYATENGKRWRPIIFISMFQTSNITLQLFPCLKKLYLFLEYIHTASLLLDDMPMMDNDDYRRDKLTVHKKYDEATCKLCSLQLLLLSQKHYNECMVELKKNGYFNNDEEFLELFYFINTKIYNYLGNHGLCYGQYIDLHLDKTDKDKYIKMIQYKTSSLFILSFSLGYIFSRKSLVNIEKIEEIGSSFGTIYQILDDLEDYETDITKHNNNILLFYSKSEIIDIIKDNYKVLIKNINSMKIGCSILQNILSIIKNKWFKNKIILYNR